MSGSKSRSEATESEIAVHWKEEGYVLPSPRFIGQATLSDPSVVERFSEKNFPECFREYADMLDWDAYWHTTLDTSTPPFWKWFVGLALVSAIASIPWPFMPVARGLVRF